MNAALTFTTHSFWRRVAQPQPGKDHDTDYPRRLTSVTLTETDVAEFAATYNKLVGVELPPAVAREKATALMLFVNALLRPEASADREGGDDAAAV